MSFIEGAKGGGRKGSDVPSPKGLIERLAERDIVARALYLSMLHEAFVLSAEVSAGRPESSAVRASALGGDRGGSCPESAPAASDVNYPGAVITGGHR